MMTAALIARLSRRLFGAPILQNNVRGEVVEEMVAMALEPEWEHCGGDWGPCDFRHGAPGLRIQVKQSAARQSWDAGEVARTNPRFAIAEKTGRYEDDGTWISERSRNAEIFVFAWHPRTDAGADHRDPEQWLFYVLAESDLPPAKSIALADVRGRARGVPFPALADAVRAVGVLVTRASGSAGRAAGPAS
jgi:hypothetical protein